MGTSLRESGRREDAGADSEYRITRWIEDVAAETTGIEPPVEIVVSHVAVDQHRRLIRSYRIATLPMAAPELYALVETIAETIAADAEDLGGLQRYQLVARCHGQDIGSTTIRCARDPMPSAVDSEPASASGLVAQAQRHAEAAVRLMVQGNGALLTSYQKRLAEQDAVIERLHGRWVESLETKEQVIQERAALGIEAEERKVDTDLRAAREIAEIDRKNALWKEALAIVKFSLPMAMQYFLGQKDDLPARGLAGETEYLATVTDEQIEQLRKRVPADLIDEFVERVQAARSSAAARPTPATPAAPAPPGPGGASANQGQTLKPLEGDAKLGAAKLLARDLLPVVTARHAAGRPLIDPATDDLSLYQLLRRLVVSSSADELAMILGALPDDQQAAAVALLDLMRLGPRAEGQVR